MKRTIPVHAVLMAVLALVGAECEAQPAPLLIGFSTPLSGPSSAFGQGLRHGAQLAVASANAAGGIGGRLIELRILDDGADHRRAADNARELIASGVLALTGVYGARATEAVASVIAVGGGDVGVVPLVAPVTSADGLREPPRPGVFHLRASTADQTSAAMLHLDTVGLTSFAVLGQNDPLGEAGRNSVQLELARSAMRPVANEQLPSGAGAAAVRRAMGKVCAVRPEAVALALDADLATAAVAAGNAIGCGARYLVFSETGAAMAVAGGGSDRHPMAGLMVTQVVPHPANLAHPLVAEYQRALARQGDKVPWGRDAAMSYPSMEGYIGMRVVIEGLRACIRDASRACLQRVLSTRALDLPGLRVQFGPTQRQSRPFVEMTLLDAQGRFRR